MKTSNRSIHQPTASGLEAQRLAEFKAMKIAKREADRDKLAREFPLLFGKDAAQKSTIGKYSLKPASKTPSKRKFVDEDVPDENIGVNKLNQTLPSRPTPGKNKAFKPSLSSTLKPKTSTNTTKFSKTTPGGFFGFGAKKASTHPHVEEIANEVEMTNEHILHKVESVEHERVIDNKPAVFVEQVQDVLDYLLENNEVDEKTYRRLSSVNFDAQAIQRFSHIPSESFDDTQAKENNHQIAIVPEEIENSNEQMPVEEMVINDLDIVHALRNYITTMEVLPVPMTTPQPSEYVSLEEEIRNSESQSNEEIPNEEDATNNSFHHRASTMPIFPRRDEVDIYGKEELLSPNSKANNKVIIYPRAVLLEKAMKEGRLSVKVTDYLCRDHHVKYMINAEVSYFSLFSGFLILF